MKTLIVLILGACLGVFAAHPLAAADAPNNLASVHKVYLTSMAGGLDQYLAQMLTREGLFAVVVDPKQADAVWSERVDEAFTDTLKDLYPPPAPAKAEKKDTGDVQVDPPRKHSFGGGRGNIFLVGVGSRQVVWSTYLNLQDRSPKAMHRAAQDIVKQLKKDIAGKE